MHTNRLFRIIEAVKLILLMTVLMLPFQNCGGGGFQLSEGNISTSFGSEAPGDDDKQPEPTKDENPPAVGIVAPVANAPVRGSVVVSGTCESGLDVSVTVDGATSQKLSCAGGTFSGTVTIGSADGNISISVGQVDLAGNVGAAQVNVLKDTVAPAVAFTAPAQNVVLTSQALNVSGTCETGLNVMLAGTLLSAAAQTPCNSGVFQASVSAVSANGSYQLTASQTDAAGNRTVATRAISVNIPAGAPTIRITGPAANSATRTGITLTGSCTNGLQVRISGTGVNQASTANCSSGAFTSAISFSNGDGTKNIIVSQTNSSNVTGQDSRSFLYDTTAPAILILSPTAGTQAETSLVVAGSCETGLTVTFSGAGLATGSTTSCNNSMFSATVNFSNNAGSKVITVTQTDAVGNTASNSRTFERIQVLSTVRQILDAKCVSCHQSGGAASFSPFTITTDAQFINAGLVTAGDPSRSKIIYRLKNYPDTSITNRNMPTTGSLTTAEYNVLYNWVSNMAVEEVTPFTCNTNDTVLAKSVPRSMKRLSQRQYKNTLIDLLSRGVSTSAATTMVNTAIGNVSLPMDDSTVFSRYDGGVVAQHMRAYFDIADAVATGVTNSTNYSNFVTAIVNLNVGSCSGLAPASLSANCVNAFISNFGLRALRRPVSSNELTVYRAAYSAAGSNAAGINAVVFKFLLAPNFLYQIEDQGTVSSGSLLRMSSYEVASRLSYMFWNSMPDESLFSRAGSNDLSTDAAFPAALNYVADSAKSQDSVKEFVSEWLHLGSIPQFAANNTILRYLADGLTLDSSLRAAMITEVQDLGAYVYSNNQSFMDLFTSNISFARDSRLVSIYGVSGAAPANVTSSNAVRFPAAERGGLLTRAALLVGGSELANPVKRGIRIRKDILCLKLDNPPAGLEDALEPPPVNVNMTTRQRYDNATSPAACMNCHQYINSLGHALGSYNSFGKTWAQEPIFDGSGQFTGRYLPISTQVDLSTSLSPGLTASGPIELSQRVASQNTTLKCFSEKALRFAEGRAENPTKEGCRLNSLYSKLKQSQSLKDFFKSVAQDPEFRHRLMQ